MSEFNIDRFLRNNKWVDGACLTPSGNGEGQLHIDLGPSAHFLIRDHGIQDFEQRMEALLLTHCEREISWDIRPVSPASLSLFSPRSAFEFPRILSSFSDTEHHRLLLEIVPDLACFSGHFPGNPVLAGVVQLHWAVVLASALFGFGSVPGQIKRLKFKSVVIPPGFLELTLSRNSGDEVQFEYSSRGQQHSQGRVVFGRNAAC